MLWYLVVSIQNTPTPDSYFRCSFTLDTWTNVDFNRISYGKIRFIYIVSSSTIKAKSSDTYVKKIVLFCLSERSRLP